VKNPEILDESDKTTLDLKETNAGDQQLADEAFKWLQARFRDHIAVFALEAGQYIIGKFYNGDSLLAFAKNKSKKQPASLNLLIKKIQDASNNPSQNAPSIVWCYNAVNLAAHLNICRELGLQTFEILGHSHKILLLNVPKLKPIQSDEYEAAITKQICSHLLVGSFHALLIKNSANWT